MLYLRVLICKLSLFFYTGYCNNCPNVVGGNVEGDGSDGDEGGRGNDGISDGGDSGDDSDRSCGNNRDSDSVLTSHKST